MFCAIWYHLYNSKNVENTQTLLKVTLLDGCFSSFLNYTNDAKSRNASHLKFLNSWSLVPNKNSIPLYVRITI